MNNTIQRHNSIKHGMTISEQSAAYRVNPELLNEIETDLLSELLPISELEWAVTRLATLSLFKLEVARNIEEELANKAVSLDDRLKLSKYTRSAERSFYQAIDKIERLKEKRE